MGKLSDLRIVIILYTNMTRTYLYTISIYFLNFLCFSFTLYPADLVLIHSAQWEGSYWRHFRFPMSTELWRHCVLSGGTQRRALPRYQSEEMKIWNISFLRVRIESTIVAFSTRTLGPCATTEVFWVLPHISWKIYPIKYFFSQPSYWNFIFA